MDGVNTTEQNIELNKYDQARADTLWNKVQYYLKQIWPYLQQLINFFIYETIKIVRGAVKIAVEQIKK